MSLRVIKTSLFAAALMSSMPLMAANFTTVDLSPYVNSNVTLGAETFPTGISAGNQNTKIPFDVATYDDVAGTWNALFAPQNTVDVSVSISGQSSFYALLNNYWGTKQADEYDITVKTTGGQSVTYQSIGGVDTRDYNNSVYTNAIVADTTFPWFDNRAGQRLDVREFNLPDSFKNDTISDVVIDQLIYGDPALLSGLTFGERAYNATPEPGSVLLLGLGLSSAGFAIRMRRKA